MSVEGGAQVGARDAARFRHRFRRQLEQIAQPGDGAADDQFRIHELVDQADRQGLVGLEHGAGHHQALGTMCAEQAAHRDLDDFRNDQADLDFVEADAEGAPRHDPVVAVQGEHCSAGRTVPGQRGDYRDRRARDGFEQADIVGPHLAHGIAIQLQQAGHVESGRKHAAATGQHDTAGALAGRGQYRFAQGQDQFAVERVDRWTGQAQFVDGFVPEDFEYGHRRALSASMGRRIVRACARGGL